MKKLILLLLAILFLSLPTKTYAVNGFSPDTNSTLTTSLVSYWDMDETSGTTVDDAINIRNGTATNTTIVNGIIGKARNLTGAGSYINIPHHTYYNLTSKISVSLWFKGVNNSDQAYGFAFGKADTTGYNGYYILMRPWGGGANFIVAKADDTEEYGVGGTDVIDNTWHHFVGVYDTSGDNRIKFYLDGAYQGSRPAFDPTTNSQPIRIGEYTSGKYIVGAVDEVGLWKKALTNQEVLDLYNSGNGNAYGPIPAPTAPTIGTGTALSTTSIQWNFTDNASNETGFKVYDTSNVLKATCATANLSSCTETGLTQGTEYTRKVVAYNAAGNSSYSSTDTVTTLSPPTAPTIGTATVISDTSIQWNFTDNASDETGFKIYDTGDVLKATCATANLSSCAETGLTANTEYTRKVVAYNDNGNSAYSSTDTATTLKASCQAGLDDTVHTISSNCSFTDTLAGMDPGTGTENTSTLILESGILTINNGYTVVAGSYNFTGGSIALAEGGQFIPGGVLYYPDADADGYPSSTTPEIAFTTPSGKRRRNLLTSIVTTDCNDSSSGYNVTCDTTFTYTGASQNFVVPAGINSITVKMWGGGGGGGFTTGSVGGGGGYSTGTIATTPGETLTVYVGGAGLYHSSVGWNGGGLRGYGWGGNGGSGGGASDIRRSSTKLIVAGGGGGGAGTNYAEYWSNIHGGAGGGTSGQKGINGNAYGTGGIGATQGAAGAGGTYAGNPYGTTGGSGSQGGHGPTQVDSGNSYCGGGGGGGYYGGGGGGPYSGGGGGSGYIGGATSATTTMGNYQTPGNSGDADRSGAGQGGNQTSNGAAGRVIIGI